MLIVCPKCFTQYKISDEILIPEGQKCHCSSCGNYFTPEDNTVLVEKAKKADLHFLPVESDVQNENVAFSPVADDIPNPSFLSQPISIENNVLEKNAYGAVPEEFKPVGEKKNKKYSLFATSLWLLLGVGICVFAYYQKDYMVSRVDSLVMNALGQNVQPKKEKQKAEEKTIQAVEKPVKLSVFDDVSSIVPQSQEEVENSQQKELGLEQSLNEQVLRVEPLDATNVAKEPITVVQEVSSFDDISEANALSNAQVLTVDEVGQLLRIQNVSYEITLNEASVQRLRIKGDIVNTSLNSVVLPEAKAVVYDENENIVARKKIIFFEKDIQGNSLIPFETSVVPAPKSVSHVEVEFDE